MGAKCDNEKAAVNLMIEVFGVTLRPFFFRHFLFGQKLRCESFVYAKHTKSHKHNFLAAPVFRSRLRGIFRLFDIINPFIGRPVKAIQWLRHFHIKSVHSWLETGWSSVRNGRALSSFRIFSICAESNATRMRLTMYSFLTSIVIKLKKKNMIGTARNELEACSQIGRSTLTQHAREPNLLPSWNFVWILLPFTQRQRALY